MGGGGPTQSSTTTPQIPPWLGKDSQSIVGSLMSSLFPGGQLQQYNQGLNQNVAGFSPFQLQAQQGAGDVYGGAQGIVQGAGQANKTLTDPNMLYAASNPYLQSQMGAVDQQMADAYKYGTAPSQMSQAIQGGAFGGSGSNQQQQENQFSFATALGDTNRNIAMQNYENQLGVMNSASQAAPGIAAGQFAPVQMLNQFGQQQQQQGQNQLNANTSNAWQQQNFPYQLLQQGTGILTPFLNAFSGSKTISPNMAGK